MTTVKIRLKRQARSSRVRQGVNQRLVVEALSSLKKPVYSTGVVKKKNTSLSGPHAEPSIYLALTLVLGKNGDVAYYIII